MSEEQRTMTIPEMIELMKMIQDSLDLRNFVGQSDVNQGRLMQARNNVEDARSWLERIK